MSMPGQLTAGFGGILNLPLEVPHPPPWRGLVPSVSTHALVLAIVLAGPRSALPVAADPMPARGAVTLFMPAPEPPRHPLARSTSIAASARNVPIQADFDPANVKIDMNFIQLSFAKDSGNQLPGVVQAYAGQFALIDRRDLNFARYVIDPPDWTLRETLEDVSGKVKVEMYPPNQWNVLRSVAGRYSVALDRYLVCALFESSFNSCLQNAIREKAGSLSHGEGAIVQSARLAFESGHPCGINVLDVSFATGANNRP